MRNVRANELDGVGGRSSRWIIGRHFFFDLIFFFGGNTDKSLEILEIIPKAVKLEDCLIGLFCIHT